MAFQALITDLNGTPRRFVGDYETMLVTRRLGDFSEFKMELDLRESAVGEVLIAERAVKVYDGSDLRFFGQVWEPLEVNEGRVVVQARDPFAGLQWRRVRAATTYTAQDAGAVVLDRLAVQNSYRDTFLSIGTVDTSVVRTVTYDAGKREDELIKELSGMADGFFFRVDPLDATPGKMGSLKVLYPDAGTSRPEVRFGYGANTLDNLSGFRLVNLLPLTRLTVASQDADGGRIAAAAENAAATAQYGLFEDELSYTDVHDTVLLQSAADAGVKPTPPLTIELSPSVNAPLLFTDFDVGDFVRLHIEHGQLSILVWVRVIEASLQVDKQGTATLAGVTVETLSGAKPNQDPARLFRAQLDATRARIEALERRVQAITTTPAAAPPPPDPTGGGGGPAPPPDDTPPPPPPPAPDRVPGAAMSSASGFWDGRGRGVDLVAGVSPFDSNTGVSFIIRDNTNGGHGNGNVVLITPTQVLAPSNDIKAVSQQAIGGLNAGGTYWVAVNAANSAGQTTSEYISFVIPSIRAE